MKLGVHRISLPPAPKGLNVSPLNASAIILVTFALVPPGLKAHHILAWDNVPGIDRVTPPRPERAA